MQAQRIQSIKSLGVQKTLDFEVNHPDHNFYAEGIVTSNSHSSAYSILTAQTVFLKFKYPIYFFKNALNLARYEQKTYEEIGKIVRELPAFNIGVLPPSLKIKNTDFEVEGEAIRVGISSLRGISDAALACLHDSNANYDFANKFELFEGIKEAGLNITVFENLIKAGCFSDFERKRGLLALEARVWNILTDAEKSKIKKVGPDYDYSLMAIMKDIKEGKPICEGKIIMKLEGTEKRKARWETFYTKYLPYRNEYLEYTRNEALFNYISEVNICGFSFSNSLRNILLANHPELISLGDFSELEEKETGIFAGIVSDKHERRSRKGNLYTKYEVFDDTSGTDIYHFESCDAHPLEKKDICIFMGEKMGDSVSLKKCKKIGSL